MNKASLFFILVAISMLLHFAMKHFILTNDVYYYALSDQLSPERIAEILKKKGKNRD